MPGCARMMCWSPSTVTDPLAKRYRACGRGRSPDSTAQVRFLRGSRCDTKQTFLRAGYLAANGRATPPVLLIKAAPYRAAGTLGHYGKLAEVFAPLACLAWALMLGTPASKRWHQILFALMFLAITGTVFATQSRSALSGVVIGCMIAAFLMSAPASRLWLISVLLVLAVAAVFWIQHTRGLQLGRHARSRNAVPPADVEGRRTPGAATPSIRRRHGFGTEPLAGVESRRLREISAVLEFHSDLVQLAAERGFLTLAAWLWFVVAYAFYLLRLLPRLRQTNPLWLRRGNRHLHRIRRLPSYLISGILAGDDTLVMLSFFCVGVAHRMRADAKYSRSNRRGVRKPLLAFAPFGSWPLAFRSWHLVLARSCSYLSS